MTFYNKDIKTIFNDFSSGKNGLKASQIEKNRELFGSNEPEKQKKDSFIKKFFQQFKNIMIIVLVISATISCLMAFINHDTENLFEGLLVFAIVIINAIVGVLQEQKAENALESLAKQTIPYAKIMRNGQIEKIKIYDIVAGDIILLKAGDYVPADIRLIDTENLKCDESSLTGESHEICKNCKILSQKNIPISSQENMCFSGTKVKSGRATGIVVATGKNSEIGKIAKSINKSKKDKTPLEKNIDKIGKVLTIGILCIVVVVFLVQILFNKNIQILDALLIAVALAVAAIPESLPAVITIIMALGVQKLAKQNAIVKKLSAIETLGSCNIICSDKTGTLTQNNMTVKHIFFNNNLTDKSSFDSQSIFITACSVCNNAVINPDKKIIADATETAIIQLLLKQNIDFEKIKSSYQKISEDEFNSTKKVMSITVSKDNTSYVFSKGAIDYILPTCDSVFIDGTVQPLDDKLIQKILKTNDNVCELGERVIALAYKPLDDKNNTKNLIFLGFLGIIDPPRKEVFEAIKISKKAGLKTIMITGDHPSTALAIAKQLGIAKSQKEILTGQDLDKMSFYELKNNISSYSVFARVTPEHKLKIVEAFKQSGNIVAMTGDGVNDAPSIKHASIGLSMGITGTDVTKEVSDIIIADDNFATIVLAIKEGRTIYNNITKTILFLLSTNIVEVLGIFVTSLIMHDAIFLLPTQILFINLITDSLPAFALGIEPAEKNIMTKPPRNSNETILSGVTGSSIIYQGFIQSLVVLVMFVFACNKYGNTVASTMSFLTICLMQIIHAINCKSEKSIFKMNIFKNKFFNFSFLFLLILILAVYFIPPLSALFSLTKLTLTQWLYVIITSIAIIPAVEIGKLIIK